MWNFILTLCRKGYFVRNSKVAVSGSWRLFRGSWRLYHISWRLSHGSWRLSRGSWRLSQQGVGIKLPGQLKKLPGLSKKKLLHFLFVLYLAKISQKLCKLKRGLICDLFCDGTFISVAPKYLVRLKT